MAQYVIERELPGAGQLNADQLQAVSKKSCSVLQNLGPQIRWLHSYVTADKIYCVYEASDEAIIQRTCPAGRLSRQSHFRS